MTNRYHQLWTATHGDEFYLHVKESKSKADVRAYIEHLYDRLADKKLIDSHFNSGFPVQFIQRWWELFVGNWLLKQGFSDLMANSEGPDFRFCLNGKNVWVECIAPNPTNPKLSSKGIGLKREVCHLVPDEYTLTLTGAIKEKVGKYNRDIENKRVSPGDVKIVAVSLSSLRDVDLVDHYDTPVLLRSLMGLGDTAISVTIDAKDGGAAGASETVQTYKEKVLNKNQAPVDTVGFLSDTYKEISGVLYSTARFVDCPDPKLKKGLTFLHNPHCTSSLALGRLNCEQELFVHENAVVKWGV